MRPRTRRSSACICMWAAVAALAGTAAGGTVHHVDATASPGGDGTTWGSAFDDLQAALEAALPGDQVWVAAGTYTPAGPGGDRDATFQLVSGVGVYGGFTGVETALDQRDAELYETTLSGDLDGNDGPGFSGNAENSHHVVTGSGTDATALLDGFTITGGHANGDGDGVCFDGSNVGQPCDGDGECPGGRCVSPRSTGAGIYSLMGSPSIIDCRVVDNFAAFQGAGIMLKSGSHATLTEVVFSGNRALDNGGAMYLGFSSPVVTDCLFDGNSAVNYAGASCNRDHSDAMFVNCQFTGNTAAETDETGGGAMVNASSSPTLIGCTFEGNTAFVGNGGSLYNKKGFGADALSSEPVLQDCHFIDSESGNQGGSVYNIEGSRPTFTGCTFTGSSAEQGGTMYNKDSEPVLAGCTITGTSALFTNGDGFNGYGGALYNEDSSPVLTGCTITGGLAERYAGAVYAGGEGVITLEDCTISDCTASLGGGVFYIAVDPDLVANRCRFIGNTNLDGFFGGSVLFSYAAVCTLTDCLFQDNVSADQGGAIMAFVTENDITCTNCLFVDNLGSDVFLDTLNVTDQQVTLINCTLTRAATNIACNNLLGDLTLVNCVVHNSVLTGTGNTQVTYSNVQFGFPGEGNITGEPVFMDPDTGDFRLQPGSPCIDAGNSDAVPAGVETDYDGLDRFVDDPDVVDSGIGNGAIVDMGAFERQTGAACPADVNGDGVVSTEDLVEVIIAWGCAPDCPADVDGNGTVGVEDLIAVIVGWGDCP